MKAIVLYEYRKSSANYNIGRKLVEQFKRQGVEVYSGYYIDEKDYDLKEFSINKSNLFIHSPKSTYYLKKRFDEGWLGRPVLNKLVFMASNPRFCFSFIHNYYDVHSDFKNFQFRLEKVCVLKGIDIIIGISFPFCLERILAGLNVPSKKYVYRLDPYAFNPCMPASSFKNRLDEENFILSNIDKMFTSELIIKDLLSELSLQKYVSKLKPVEFPLINDSNSYPIERHRKTIIDKKNDSLYILHAGSFYEDIRNPAKLVSFMQKLPIKYKLCVAGINSYAIRDYDEVLRDRIIDLGCLSRDDVTQAIYDCDYLISYNNLNTNMVPSKLFECIDSGKPFINLCQSKECPTIQYVKDYSMAFTVIIDGDFEPSGLITFLEETRGKYASRDEIMEKFEKCTIKYISNQFLDAAVNA